MVPVVSRSRVPLPAPLRSPPVTALPRYYGRSDSYAGGSSARQSMNTVVAPRRSPCVLHHAVMPIPSPPTWCAPMALLHATRSTRRSLHRCRLRLRRCDAGSSLTPGRIEFVILRTRHSPSIALHLASRRRSYRWVRAGERLPGEDSHLSVMAPLQAHVAPRERAGRVRRIADRRARFATKPERVLLSAILLTRLAGRSGRRRDRSAGRRCVTASARLPLDSAPCLRGELRDLRRLRHAHNFTIRIEPQPARRSPGAWFSRDYRRPCRSC